MRKQINKRGKKLRLLLGLMICLSLVVIGGCSNKTIPNSDEVTPIVFIDDLGREVSMNVPKKVAILSGSLADAWLLAGGALHAITEDAKELIAVTDDMRVVGSLKNPSMELLIEEDIEFAILSAALAEHVNLMNNLEAVGITTAYFDVETFDDYANMMRILTDMTGRADLYDQHVEAIASQIDEQISRGKNEKSPKVLFLRAFSTGVRAKGSDSMTGAMLQDLGCINIADSSSGVLEELSMEAIVEAEPDFIFVTTMGESQEKAMEMVDKYLLSHPAWNGLEAVKNQRYYVLPKALFHNKPNQRWAQSYQMLADYLYGYE